MAERPEKGIEGRLCDICHRRPAAVRVTVVENGRRRTLNACEQDYARLQAQSASPFESLFGGTPFGEDLFGSFFGDEGAGAERGAGRPRGRSRDRESVDLTE